MEVATIFNGTTDRYNGVTVDSQNEPCDQDKFCTTLKESLLKWVEDERRCIWFKVNIKDAAWVPLLAENGFDFHHAQKEFVMMYKCLPTQNKCNLPPTSHTNLGVGGMVFNEKNQLLVVSEQHYEYPHWKLPGGYVEQGEDLKDAAIREVKEETNIDTEFVSMVTFRHTHDATFGNSDIYVVIKLKALSETIEKSDKEIKACQWMDVDEFLNHPHVHEFNRFIVKQSLEQENRKIKFNLLKNTVKISNWCRDITALVLEDLE